MGYKMDMSKERERGLVLPEGWREFEILACEESTSKQGNEMFIFTVKDVDLNKVPDDIYAVATQGKRWFLKQILSACGIEAGKDGVYNFEVDDLIGQVVLGKVESVPEEYINREGETVKVTKSKITQVKAK